MSMTIQFDKLLIPSFIAVIHSNEEKKMCLLLEIHLKLTTQSPNACSYTHTQITTIEPSQRYVIDHQFIGICFL